MLDHHLHIFVEETISFGDKFSQSRRKILYLRKQAKYARSLRKIAPYISNKFGSITFWNVFTGTADKEFEISAIFHSFPFFHLSCRVFLHKVRVRTGSRGRTRRENSFGVKVSRSNSLSLSLSLPPIHTHLFSLLLHILVGTSFSSKKEVGSDCDR